MRKISLYLMLLTSAVFIASCEKPNVRMHTIIHEDGWIERQITYSTIMSQEMRDSLWSGDNVCLAEPVPECLNIDAFMGSHTDASAASPIRRRRTTASGRTTSIRTPS